MNVFECVGDVLLGEEPAAAAGRRRVEGQERSQVEQIGRIQERNIQRKNDSVTDGFPADGRNSRFSIRGSVGPSVCNAFIKTRENRCFSTNERLDYIFGRVLTSLYRTIYRSVCLSRKGTIYISVGH